MVSKLGWKVNSRQLLGLYGPYKILFRDASTKLHNGIPLSYNIS